MIFSDLFVASSYLSQSVDIQVREPSTASEVSQQLLHPSADRPIESLSLFRTANFVVATPCVIVDLPTRMLFRRRTSFIGEFWNAGQETTLPEYSCDERTVRDNERQSLFNEKLLMSTAKHHISRRKGRVW